MSLNKEMFTKAIKNYFYLVAGILAILFSVTHALNGQMAVIPLVDGSNLDLNTQTTFFYIWHIITSENLIFGVAFLIMAFYKKLSQVRFTAWIIALILIVRLVVILGSTLLRNYSLIKGTLTDGIAIILYAGLIILGTRVKDI